MQPCTLCGSRRRASAGFQPKSEVKLLTVCRVEGNKGGTNGFGGGGGAGFQTERLPLQKPTSRQRSYFRRSADVENRRGLSPAPPALRLCFCDGRCWCRGYQQDGSVWEDKWPPRLSSAARSRQVALLALPPAPASLCSSSFVLRPPQQEDPHGAGLEKPRQRC